MVIEGVPLIVKPLIVPGGFQLAGRPVPFKRISTLTPLRSPSEPVLVVDNLSVPPEVNEGIG